MSNHKQNRKQKKQKSGNGAGIIAFGAVYAVLSAIFHPHSLLGYLLTAAFSFFGGSIIRVMAQGLDLTTHNKEPESLQKVQTDTGNPEVDELLSRGREMIREIRHENDLIPEESLSAKLDVLENACAEIFRAVYEKPAKAPQIRKFMEYYLPTTLKMVKSYRMLGERDFGNEENRKARARIDEALGVVNTGCHHMLDQLYRDDMLDITTDIDVLEQMLKRDGLTENDLRKAAQQARDAAQLDNQLEEMRRRMQAAQQNAQATPVQQAVPVQQTAPMQQAVPAQQATPVQQAARQVQYIAAPVMNQSGNQQPVSYAQLQAQQHFPQAPTLSGGMYPPAAGAQAQAGAQAVAQSPENQ